MSGVEVPRVVVAGAGSGVGKTTLVLGLAAALARRGLRVGLFKTGPDFLDPLWHRCVPGVVRTGRLCPWLQGEAGVSRTLAETSGTIDVALVEGMMGLFDGLDGASEEGSTAHVARLLEAPVFVALDARASSRTLAAVAHGLAVFSPGLRVEGVLTTRFEGEAHARLLRRVFETPRWYGGMPTLPTAERLPERALGLVPPPNVHDATRRIERLAQRAERFVDLDGLLSVARSAPPLSVPQRGPAPPARARRLRLGVARDDAFVFVYEENLRRLEEWGAETVFVSPLSDAGLPDVDALYLPGGYPELHAETLAANRAFLADVRALAARGAPIVGECGGYLYLLRSLTDLEGREHRMAGLLPGRAQATPRLQGLALVEVESTAAASAVVPPGTRLRGHVFHWARDETEAGAKRPLRARTATGGEWMPTGLAAGSVVGSWVHVHLDSIEVAGG